MSKTSPPNNGHDALELSSPHSGKEAQARISNLKELTEKFKATEKKFEQDWASLKKMLAEQKQLLEGLKIVKEELQKNNAELTSQLRESKEKAAQVTEIDKGEVEQKQVKVETEISSLQSRNQELQKTIATLTKKLTMAVEFEEEPPDGIKIQPATFGIVIYPREDNYHGKIVHNVSKAKKILKGLDQHEIMQFISEHLPPLEKQTQKPEALVSPNSKKSSNFLSELHAMQAGHEQMENFVVGEKKPLQVKMKIDLSTVSSTDIPLFYKLTVYAKNLESKIREQIGETASILTSASAFPVSLQTKIMPPGTYRLQADLTSKLKDGKMAQYNSFVEGGVVQIYQH